MKRSRPETGSGIPPRQKEGRTGRLMRGLLIGGLIGAIASAGVVLVIQFELASGPPTCGSGGFVTPCPSKEALSLDSYRFNTATNVTLNTWNTGNGQFILVAYCVKDSSGDLFDNSYWPGSSVAPNAHMPVNIILDGKAFVFQAGNDYTITLVTSWNQQFTLMVIL